MSESGGFHIIRIRTMPNSLPVFVNCPHTMERHAMNLPFCIHQLKSSWIVLWKRNLPQRHHDNALLHPIEVTQLELPSCEFGIPTYPIEQLMNWCHEHF